MKLRFRPNDGDYIAYCTSRGFLIGQICGVVNHGNPYIATTRLVDLAGVIHTFDLQLENQDRFATDTEILEAKLRYGL